jgi:5-oxoprolinase (ATP-hydrolysing)
MVARGGTTCVDAYLTPVIKRYLASFCKGFDDNLRNVNVSFMQSDGGHSSMPQVVYIHAYIHTYIYLQV